MAKNPAKGFTLDQLKKASEKSQKEMVKNAEILNKQNPETSGPNYEKIEEFDHAGADGYDGSVEKTDSPLDMYAYVSTAPHFQRLQDNIAAAFTPKKKSGPTSEDKKNQAEEAYWKSKTTTSKEIDKGGLEEGFGGAQTQAGYDYFNDPNIPKGN